MRFSKWFKTSFLLTLTALSVLMSTGSSLAQDQTSRKLLVTAYYSPLPDQSFYIRGSYEADVRLNGRGTHGADGTAVYPGMLAAPSTYPFGTRIRIPGLGVGEVHDRGGAIIEGQDYDRIDVWMGEGEEGLARALNWGARMVDGEVYYDPSMVEAGLDFSWVSPHLSSAYVAQLQAKMESSEAVDEEVEEDVQGNEEGEQVEFETAFEDEVEVVESVIVHANDLDIQRLQASQSFLKSGLYRGDQGEEVTHLQKTLWELGYFQEELTDIYDENTEAAVLAFQLDHGVISNAQSAGAGRFGPMTYEALKQASHTHVVILDEHKDPVQTWVPAKKDMPRLVDLSSPESSETSRRLVFIDEVRVLEEEPGVYVAFNQELDLEDSGEAVRALQTFLIAEGYLAVGLNTGYYGQQTQAAVLAFQLAHGLVSSEDDLGAGRVGPKTLDALNRVA